MRFARSLALLAALAACDTFQAPSAPGPLATTAEECDPVTALEPCPVEPGYGGGGGWLNDISNHYFGVDDRDPYRAPGDPNPSAEGIWLGSEVSPSACNAPTLAYDTDRDGLHNTCEYRIARSFAPLLAFDDDEICSAGEPHWAARPFYSATVVRVAYMPAYYDDCGYKNQPRSRADAHRGDSEMVVVEVGYDTTTLHWKVRRVWMSAHYGATGDHSGWKARQHLTFHTFPATFPTAYVARDKHANYTSRAACENAEVYVFAENILEDCSDTGQKVRFPVLEHRNAGSPVVPTPCARAENPGRGSEFDREECFMVPSSTFQGWYPAQDGAMQPKSYHTMLTSGSHFQYY